MEENTVTAIPSGGSTTKTAPGGGNTRRTSGIGFWVGTLTALCIAIAVLVVSIVIVSALGNAQKSEIAEEKTDGEILYDISAAVMDMPVDEAISFLDAQIAHYGDSELGFQLKMLKLHTYESHNMPQQLIVAARQVDIENKDEIDKIDYYCLLSQAYQKMGDEENATLYYEIFNVLKDGGYEGEGI